MTDKAKKVLTAADHLLEELAFIDQLLADQARRKAAAMEAAARPFIGQEARWVEERAAMAAELMALMQDNRAAVFGDISDSAVVDLASGTLRYALAWPVKRAKKMVEKLKAARRADLIKITEAADWDLIEALDDEALAAIGTGRVEKETFDFDLK